MKKRKKSSTFIFLFVLISLEYSSASFTFFPDSNVDGTNLARCKIAVEGWQTTAASSSVEYLFTSLSHRQKYDDTGESFSLQLVIFANRKKKYLFTFQMCLDRNFTRTLMLSKIYGCWFYLVLFFQVFSS